MDDDGHAAAQFVMLGDLDLAGKDERQAMSLLARADQPLAGNEFPRLAEAAQPIESQRMTGAGTSGPSGCRDSCRAEFAHVAAQAVWRPGGPSLQQAAVTLCGRRFIQVHLHNRPLPLEAFRRG